MALIRLTLKSTDTAWDQSIACLFTTLVCHNYFPGTTPLRLLFLNNTAWTYLQLPLWQCLSLSVVQLNGEHCRKPHCRNGSCRYVQAVYAFLVIVFLIWILDRFFEEWSLRKAYVLTQKYLCTNFDWLEIHLGRVLILLSTNEFSQYFAQNTNSMGYFDANIAIGFNSNWYICKTH